MGEYLFYDIKGGEKYTAKKKTKTKKKKTQKKKKKKQEQPSRTNHRCSRKRLK